MDAPLSSISVVLYTVVAISGAVLLVAWMITARTRRNAGFATKSMLKRNLSAKTVVRATEIRPAISDGTKSRTTGGSSTLANRPSV